MQKQGILFVVTGPSGVGKRTLIEHIQSVFPQFWLSVSATTRAPRFGETYGRDYLFVRPPEFLSRIDRGDLLEYAEYADNFYGTPRGAIMRRLADGVPVIAEVEIQGAKQIKKNLPEAKTIFIAPPRPQIPTLRQRLVARGTETRERIEKRLKIAEMELAEQGFFDQVIVNDDLAEAKRRIVNYVTHLIGTAAAA